MTTDMDLKQLESKAWRSSFQDGLLDIYLGLLLVVLSIPELLPGVFTSALGQYAARVVLMLLASLFYWMAKRYVSNPRIGRARFGPARQSRRTRAVVLYGISALGLALIFFLILAWVGATSARQEPWLGVREIFGLGLGVWVMLLFGLGSYLMEFSRGYWIGVLYALAFGGTTLLDGPALFAICGGILVLVGLAVFVRFLRTHPKPAELESGTSNESA